MNISEHISDGEEQQRLMAERLSASIRTAMPGIVLSFDPVRQTAEVQPAVKEILNGNAEALPVLPDVPVQFPRAGGYCLTLPVKPGDECLVVFCDMCIDGWWQSGGVQGQMEKRRHDLSDAVAIIGITSVPRAVAGYSADTIQLRNEAGDICIELSENGISIMAPKLVIKAGEITIDSNATMTGNMSIDGNLSVSGGSSVAGIDFAGHVHGGVLAGKGKTDIPEKKEG